MLLSFPLQRYLTTLTSLPEPSRASSSPGRHTRNPSSQSLSQHSKPPCHVQSLHVCSTVLLEQGPRVTSEGSQGSEGASCPFTVTTHCCPQHQFSNLNIETIGELAKTALPTPPPSPSPASDSAGLGWRFCSSDALPGDADAAGQAHPLEPLRGGNVGPEESGLL